jgi:predicted nucleic acid-binding protein
VDAGLNKGVSWQGRALSDADRKRRGRSSQADTSHFLDILASFPITVNEETVARAWVQTMHRARAHNLSSSDASYLALAMRLGWPMATLDARLKTAGKAVGVPLFAVQ